MSAAWSVDHAAAVRRAVRSALDAPDRTVEGLATHLYATWYAAPVAGRQRLDPLDPPLSGVLRESHAATGRWADGVVVRVGPGGVVAVRGADGRVRAAERGAYAHYTASQDLGLVPRAGDGLRVLEREGAVVVDGWWRTWGGGWDPRRLPADVTRIYLTPDTARLPALVAALTGLLGRGRDVDVDADADTDVRTPVGPPPHPARIPHSPWYLKVGVAEVTLDRPDAVVVYVPDAVAAEVLGRVADLVRDLVRPSSGPPLTRAVAPGVAWSHDPGDGQSFGENRCAILAAALADPEAGLDPLAACAAAFARAGLDPTAPHLRAGSTGRGRR